MWVADNNTEDLPDDMAGAREPGQAGGLVVSEHGTEDPEHPASASARHPRLQRQLVIILDEQTLDKLTARPSPDTRRLTELADKSVSSEWLWALDPAQPECVEAAAYVAAVRLRLGAGFSAEPLQCRVCRGSLDPAAVHTTCCAPGESTRGHNEVRDCLFDLVHLADATAEQKDLRLVLHCPGSLPGRRLDFGSVSGPDFSFECWYCSR